MEKKTDERAFVIWKKLKFDRDETDYFLQVVLVSNSGMSSCPPFKYLALICFFKTRSANVVMKRQRMINFV